MSAGYTGDVPVHGPAAIRDVHGLRITKAVVGPYANNVYLLECRSTGEQLLIDAADEAEVLLDLAGPAGLTKVVTTHGHYDHWQALKTVAEKTGAHTVAHPADAPHIPVGTDCPVRDGDHIAFGNIELVVAHLVGHTAGSIALSYEEPGGITHIFTGDALFPGGIGKTHDEPELFSLLLAGVTRKLFDPYPDSTWIYPGHGPDTTLGAERPKLAEWKTRGW